MSHWWIKYTYLLIGLRFNGTKKKKVKRKKSETETEVERMCNQQIKLHFNGKYIKDLHVKHQQQVYSAYIQFTLELKEKEEWRNEHEKKTTHIDHNAIGYHWKGECKTRASEDKKANWYANRFWNWKRGLFLGLFAIVILTRAVNYYLLLFYLFYLILLENHQINDNEFSVGPFVGQIITHMPTNINVSF